jgi:DNA polymerase IIIc chi subunit
MYELDTDQLPRNDETAMLLLKWFAGKQFTKKEVVDLIADMSEDREYAKWEFDQLVDAGYNIEAS